MQHFKKQGRLAVAALMAALVAGLGCGVQQADFQQIIALHAPLFLLYVLVCRQSQIPNPKSQIPFFWLAAAVLLRALLLFSMPNLSNDVHRFLWDGRLLAQGFNPFDHLPSWYLENGAEVEGIDRALFEAFGSKDTYTSYPPLAQAQFASAVWLFPKSVLGAVVVMKLWLFLFEIGTLFLMVKLLRRFDLPAQNVLWYALNPLVILEITGNLHFEGAMIFFLLLALWLLAEPRRTDRVTASHPVSLSLSAAAFALSVCSKLLPLLFLPFLIKRLGWRRSLRYFSVVGGVTAALFLPLLNASFFANFGSSLSLYFQKLEYNASLYYLARWLGWQLKGYNWIAVVGPALGLLAAAGILALAFVPPNPSSAAGAPPNWGSAAHAWLFAFCIYLACATTVHPWYLCLPLALCVFTRWRFPVVWSGLIFLTYVNYSYEPFHENLWVVALEYAAVAAWLLWEWKTQGKKPPAPLPSPDPGSH